MEEIECPYCGAMNNEPDEYYEYDEDEPIEMQCSDCDKSFTCSYYRIIGWHDAQKLDCANDGDHNFENFISSHGIETHYYKECNCGERVEITREEYINKQSS